MIDISMLAPSAAATAGPGTGTGTPLTGDQASSGAAGFLRLFEIIIGGMPKPGGEEAAMLSPDSVQNPAMVGALPSNATIAGNSPASATNDPTAILDGITGESALDSASSTQIASLLQTLGFDVRPDQIASLAPLDQVQLDQAMEFIQRGIESGMPTNVILENAAFLMPREWDYQGSSASVAPRSELLATPDAEPDSADPATILAASELVRQVLVAAGAIASVATPSSEKSRVDTTSKLQATLPSETGSTPASAAASESTLAASTRSVANQEVSADSKLRSSSAPRGDSTDSSLVSSDDASGENNSADNPVADRFARMLAGHDSVRKQGSSVVENPKQGSPSGSQVRSEGHARFEVPGAESSAKSTASNATQAPIVATSVDPSGSVAISSALSAVPFETRSLQVQGVKPGSMASEFIGRQVLEKVDVHLKQGKRELSVRLWPEELGEVRLSLRIGEADKLDARILVQTESVRQAILDATPQLREALSRNGMEMGRLSVTVDQSRTGSQQTGGERREPSREQARQRSIRNGWAEEEFDYAAPLALGIDSGIRDGRNTLDMWS